MRVTRTLNWDWAPLLQHAIWAAALPCCAIVTLVLWFACAAAQYPWATSIVERTFTTFYSLKDTFSEYPRLASTPPHTARADARGVEPNT